MSADALAQEAESLSHRAEAARAKAAAATAAQTAAQSVRRQDFDRRWLADYSDQTIEAEQGAALATFEAAALADPVTVAWLEVERLRLRRFNMGQIAANFASGLGVKAPTFEVSRSPALMSERLQRTVEGLAVRLEAERTAAVYQAREQAAEAAAEGGE